MTTSIKRLLLALMLLGEVAFADVHPVKVFVQQSVSSSSSTGTFTTSATNAGDVIAIQAAAAAGTLPTSVTITASGWTFTQITPGSGVTTWPTVAAAASFCAIAPNTASVTFTATFSGGATFTDISIIGQEFSGNDGASAAAACEAGNSAIATSGSPTVNVTPLNANDAIWGATQDTATAVGTGFTKGADDSAGDWTESKTLSGGAGTPVMVSFTGGPGYIIQAIAIKPATFNVRLKGRVGFKGKVILK